MSTTATIAFRIAIGRTLHVEITACKSASVHDMAWHPASLACSANAAPQCRQLPQTQGGFALASKSPVGFIPAVSARPVKGRSKVGSILLWLRDARLGGARGTCNGFCAMRGMELSVDPDTAGINPAARWGDPCGLRIDRAHRAAHGKRDVHAIR